MPFTSAEFFAAFARYNSATWPGPVLLLVLGLIIGGLAIATATPASAPRSTQQRDHGRTIMFFLAGLWTWMALVYQLTFFRAINPVAPAFAALFLAQAGALCWLALRPRGGPDASTRTLGPWRRALGAAFLGYALVIYPAVGLLLGQRYPALPSFGLPCPTTLYTLGIFTLSTRPVPWLMYLVPTVWAAIATSAAVAFGIGEDFVLLPAVALALALNARWLSHSERTLPA